jgi:hypothetical protein
MPVPFDSFSCAVIVAKQSNGPGVTRAAGASAGTARRFLDAFHMSGVGGLPHDNGINERLAENSARKGGTGAGGRNHKLSINY